MKPRHDDFSESGHIIEENLVHPLPITFLTLSMPQHSQDDGRTDKWVVLHIYIQLVRVLCMRVWMRRKF